MLNACVFTCVFTCISVHLSAPEVYGNVCVGMKLVLISTVNSPT